MVAVELNIAYVGIVISIISLAYTFLRNRTGDIREMENRLTTIEVTLQNKLDPLWEAVIHEIPKLLISPHTPSLDILLTKYLNGWNDMTREEAGQLEEGLKEELRRNEDSGKGVALKLALAGLRVRINEKFDA